MESVSFVGEEKAQIGFDGGVAAGIMCGEGEREVGRSSADEIDMGGGVGLVMGGAVSASCREEDRMDEEAEGGSSAELRVSSPNSTERLWAVVSDPDVLFFLSLASDPLSSAQHLGIIRNSPSLWASIVFPYGTCHDLSAPIPSPVFVPIFLTR
jgi:hypothetical protein